MHELIGQRHSPKTAPFDVPGSREAVLRRFKSADSGPHSVGADGGAWSDIMAELHIEDVTREAELHMKNRLLPILTDLQRQPVVAQSTQHMHSAVVTRDERPHDRISDCP